MMRPCSQASNHAQALPDALASTDGTSLVEAVVAMVLIMVALLPLAAAVVFAAARPDARVEAEALARAQAAVEETLSLPPEAWRTGTEDDDLWRVERVVTREGALATVEVLVFRGARADTLHRLQTARHVVSSPLAPDWAPTP